MLNRSFIFIIAFFLTLLLVVWAEETEGESTEESAETLENISPEIDGKEARETTDTFRLRWNNFLEASRSLMYWELLDNRLTIQGGAYLEIDGTTGNGNEIFVQTNGDINTSLNLRRFWAFARGTFDKHLRYIVAFDLGADTGLKDVYVEGLDRGLSIWGYDIGRFRLGSFGEPFSMERRTVRNSLAFLERSLPVWTFAPGNNFGYMLYDTAWEGRVSWQAGFFSLGNVDEDNASASVLSITGRLTWLPIYKNDGRTLLHVGASYSSRDPRSNEVHYRSRPEARFAPFVVDTGRIESTGSALAGFEIAFKNGPLWAHGEVIQAAIDSTQHSDPRFWGAFVQAGFFLTGESRPYNQTEGIWGNVDPISGIDRGIPFKDKFNFKKGDRGAVGLSARISTLDLDDELISGGKLTNMSVGISWYPTPASRWMCEYIFSSTENEGNANILLIRYQYALQ